MLKKLNNFRNSVFALVISIIADVFSLKVKDNAGADDLIIVMLMICVSVIFLFTLTGRHNAGMDHPLLNMYSFFLLYISIAFLVYSIFPNNILGAIVSIPAVILVIFSVSNFIKIRKDK